jgi:hypothetical protein
VNELNGLLKKIVMKRHYQDHSGSLRVACSDLLRKLKYGITPQFS